MTDRLMIGYDKENAGDESMVCLRLGVHFMMVPSPFAEPLMDIVRENERLRDVLSQAGNIMYAENLNIDFIEEALSNKHPENATKTP